MRDTELASAATSTPEPSPTARHLPSVTDIFERLAARAGLKHGFVDDTRRAATPHVVDCQGLSRENLSAVPSTSSGWPVAAVAFALLRLLRAGTK